MINLDSVRSSHLHEQPFKYCLLDSFIPEKNIDALLSNLPNSNYYRSIRETGSDKTYNVVNNILLKLGEKEYNKENKLDESWIKFITDLHSAEYINLISMLVKEDLSGCHQEITLKKYGHGDFISAHTDQSSVKATHMLFLNKKWDVSWGGQLCLMNDADSTFKKIEPVSVNSVVFVRADNSWHSVEKITNPSAERIAIQVAFWNISNRQIMPGRIEQYI